VPLAGNGTSGASAPEAVRDLYRCDISGCGELITLNDIETTGGCPFCGGRRVRECGRMTKEKWDALIARGAIFKKELWGAVE
jgi:GMP synthase PP-ATPase subunit